MRQVKAIKPFANYETHEMYGVGEVVSLPDARAQLAIDRGLATEIAEKKAAPKKPAVKRKPTKKEG